MIDSSQHTSTITCTDALRVWHFSAFHYLQFLCFSRFLSRVVTSAVYSGSPDGNRNWRYRVVDVDISVCGDVLLLEGLQDALEGAHSVLAGLCFASPTPTISYASTCNPLFFSSETPSFSPPILSVSLVSSSCTSVVRSPLVSSQCSSSSPTSVSSCVYIVLYFTFK